MAPRSDPKEKPLNLDDDAMNEEDDVVAEPEEELSEDDLAEIASVNNHLDSLNTALDAIEQRNDDIHAQLLELLTSNRAIRESLQQEANASRPSNDKEPPSTGSNSESTQKDEMSTD